MKNLSMFFSLFIVAILSLVVMAQSPWFLQRAFGTPSSINPQVTFSAVDDNVCWGINYSNSQYLRTTDGGSNWLVSTITGATGFYGSCVAALDANTAFAAMNDPTNLTSGGVFKTTDGGQTWSKQTTAFPGSGGYPADIHFFDSNFGVVIGNPHNGNWEIYTTKNGGEQWDQVPFTNIPPPALNEFTASALYASAGNSIWFSTWGNAYHVYRSTDQGFTWAKSNVPANTTWCVAFKDSLNGLATNCFLDSNTIARTTNGGVTWESLPNVPDTPSTYSITYVKGTNGAYVITAHNNIAIHETTIPGSIYSTNDGTTWHLFDNVPRNRIAFNSAYNGWSGGVNDSVYKWSSDILLPVEISFNSLPEKFVLEQNYPNPFNPSTTIRYSIPTSEFVTLKVFDVLGNEITTLVNEEKTAGTYEVDFQPTVSGHQMANGVYFYQLRVAGFVETKKMILLK